MKKSRFILFTTIILALFVLTACAAPAEPVQEAEAPVEIEVVEEAEPAEEVEEVAEVQEPVELNFPSHFWGESTHGAFFEGLVAEFEAEHPNITVVGSNVPLTSYWDKTYAELSAGTPADIVNPFDPQIQQYIKADFLEDLTPYLEEAGYTTDDFYPIIEAAMKDGKIYAIPYGLNPRVYMYNADMFEAAGVSVPTNVEEFKEVVRALRNTDTQDFGYATMAASASPNITYIEIMALVGGFGRGFVLDGEANATAPETVAALELLKELYDEELIPIGQDHTVYRDMFTTGKVASLGIGAFMKGVVKNDNPDLYDSIAVAPLPFPGGNTISINTFLAVPKDAENKEAAIQFLLKVLEDQWQSKITEFTGAIPARLGISDPDYMAANPWFQTVIDVTDSAFPYTPDGAEQYAPEVIDIIVRHYEAMLFDDISAQETAENMQAELEAFLADK